MSTFKRYLKNVVLGLAPPVMRPLLRGEWSRLQRHVGHYEREDRREFFRRAFYALAFNGISGDYLEFGCHEGMTFTLAHGEIRRVGPPRKCWAFDSFQGLPPQREAADSHPHWQVGDMATSLADFHRLCAEGGIPRESYETIAGYYSETLVDPVFLARAPHDVCLAYIDCDLYSSTQDVIKFLLPRMKHGMILAFDDYYCWSATEPSGERRALNEALGGHTRWQLVPFVQYGWNGMSFVVEERRTPPIPPLGAY